MKTETPTTPHHDAIERSEDSGLVDIAALLRTAGGDAPRPLLDSPSSKFGASPIGPPLLISPASLARKRRRHRVRAAVPVLAAALVAALGATAAAQWSHRAPAAVRAPALVATRAPKVLDSASPEAAALASPVRSLPAEPVAPSIAEVAAPSNPDVSTPTRAAVRPPAIRRASPAPSAPVPTATTSADSGRAPAGDFASLTASTIGSSEPVTARSDLPALPSRTDVASVLRPLGTAIARCGEGDGTVAMGRIVIDGPTGRVVRASVDGPLGDTAVGACVAGVLEEARFAPFERTRFEVTYPYRL